MVTRFKPYFFVVLNTNRPYLNENYFNRVNRVLKYSIRNVFTIIFNTLMQK